MTSSCCLFNWNSIFQKKLNLVIQANNFNSRSVLVSLVIWSQYLLVTKHRISFDSLLYPGNAGAGY